MEDTMLQEITGKINSAINEIRPYLNADGGDVELVGITTDMTVRVRLKGACEGCPFNVMTLKAGLEQAIRSKFPEMKELVAVD
jgi:Fe-S cluster biogenesis protein NfuA